MDESVTNQAKARFAFASDIGIAAMVIIVAMLTRAFFMEYTDLIDPTEARYASVAQQMVMGEGWATPKLPTSEGIVPYMGKPPLHFWLTAISYKLFGVEEWTSRLPSFLAALGILLAVFHVGRRYYGPTEAYAACLIAISSAMFFFLAGASVTDVTLTLTVTWGTIFLYRFVSEKPDSNWLIYCATACAALAFLCKGPLGVVLIGLPILLFSSIRRDFTWIKLVPWFRASVMLVVLVAPWFAINEMNNPGSLKYFFWNENVARYLFTNYGDKYGSGHVHTHGASWVMLFLAFAPWTVSLASFAFPRRFKLVRSMFANESHLAFIGCWAVTAPLFFTFVRQLHAMYIFPAIPPLAVFTGILLARFRTVSASRSTRSVSVYAFLFWLLLVIGASALHFSLFAATIGLCVVLLGVAGCIALFRRATFLNSLSRDAWLCAVTYVLIIAVFTPYVNVERSAEEILKQIANEGLKLGSDRRTVGIFSNNSFSHFWVAGAWENELATPIDVKYIEPEEAAESGIQHYMVKAKNQAGLPQDLLDHFTLQRSSGDWLVYVRKGMLAG